MNYHGVLPDGYVCRDPFLDGNLISKETLRNQLHLLQKRYHVISPEAFRKWMNGEANIPSRAVLITCDDGLLNTLTDMLPVLASEGVPCLFFVLGASCHDEESRLWYEELYELLECERDDAAGVSGLADLHSRWWQSVQEASRLDLEQRKEWMRNLRSRCQTTTGRSTLRRWCLLNADQLRQMAAAGMEIGAHTVSHPVLSACAEDLARREIQESKRDLERVLGRSVWAFAYPFGNPSAMGDREVRLAREAGFTCAFVNTGGGVVDRSDPFTLSRAHVTAQMNLAEFEAHVTGLHQRLQRAIRG